MFTDYSELMKIKIQEHNELYMINHYNIVGIGEFIRVRFKHTNPGTVTLYMHTISIARHVIILY